MEQRTEDKMLAAIDSIADLFGTRRGIHNIHRLCHILFYKDPILEKLPKAAVIKKILTESYLQDNVRFVNFMVALLTNHDLQQRDLDRLDLYLKELGYELRLGGLRQISPIREAMGLAQRYPSIFNKAVGMAEAYVTLNTFENVMRQFVRVCLEEEFGSKWWEKGVPERVRTSAQKTKLQETNSPWHDVEAVDLLDYTTFENLHGIIQTNWKFFERYLHDQVGLTGRLKELEIPRNTIAHNRKLVASEMERLKLFVNDIIKCVPTDNLSR